MVNSNVTTITLNGNKAAVEFEKGYPYYFVRNDGNETIYVSMSPNIDPDEAEGIYTVPAGGTERIGAGYSLSKFYILGTGEVYIRGEQIATPPSFKQAGKGGEKDDRGYKVVTELPETGSSKYIYLVPKSSLLSDNIYNEYLWIDEEQRWELVGDTEIDLTDYAKKSELNSHIGDKSNPHNVTAKQIKMNDVYNGAFGNSISSLQNTILNWYGSTIESLSVFRFQGNADINFYIDNWENNFTLIDTSNSRATYTVKVISSNVGYALRSVGTFLITSNSLQDESQNTTSFITYYDGINWYMYGRLITEKSEMLSNILPPATTITSSSDDSTVPTSKAVYDYINPNDAYITDNTIDWNTLTEQRLYYISFNGGIIAESHGPVGASGWGILEIVAKTSDRIFQRYTDLNSNSGVYIRFLFGDTWYDWRALPYQLKTSEAM